MTEPTAEFEGFPEPGEQGDPDLGFKTEDVPEVQGHEDPPENDQELGDEEPEEDDGDGV